MVMLLAVANVCEARKTPSRSRIQGLVNDMRVEARLAGVSAESERVVLPGIKVVSESNIEMVSIGGIGMKLGKAVSGLSREIPAVRGISSMLVVSYEDCPDTIKEKFNSKMARELNGCEVLMEAKDSEDKVTIYGTSSGDGSRISDIIMFVPNDGALICFFGTINAEDLADLVESSSETYRD